MSDVTDPIGPIGPIGLTQGVDEKTVKSKRVMSEAQLSNLANARIKALEKRKEIKSLNEREKSIKQQELQKRIDNISIQEKSISVSLPRVKKKKSPSPEYSSDSSFSDSSDDEVVHPLPRAVKKTAVKNPRKVPTEKLTTEVARNLLQQRIHQDNMDAAFHSLFPGHRRY